MTAWNEGRKVSPVQLVVLGLFLSILCPSFCFVNDLTNTCVKSPTGYPENEAIPCQVLDEFMAALNSGDSLAWAETLNYPHIRLAGNGVLLWMTPQEYARTNDLNKLIAKRGWKESKWDRRTLIQKDENKYHYAVQVSRYGQDGKKIATFESFYIITNLEGHWGVQGRSSYAGVTVEGAAY
jgi:hypothetical protein